MSTISIHNCDSYHFSTDIVVCPGYSKIARRGFISSMILSHIDPLILDTYRRLYEPVRNGSYITLPGSSIARSIIYINEAVGITRQEEMIQGLYDSIISCALKSGFHSICFPLIGVENYGYDSDKGWKIALKTADRAIKDNREYGLDIHFLVSSLILEHEGKKMAEEMKIREIRSRTGLDGTEKIRITIRNEKEDEEILTLRENGKICYRSYMKEVIDRLITFSIRKEKVEEMISETEELFDSADVTDKNGSRIMIELINRKLHTETLFPDSICSMKLYDLIENIRNNERYPILP